MLHVRATTCRGVLLMLMLASSTGMAQEPGDRAVILAISDGEIAPPGVQLPEKGRSIAVSISMLSSESDAPWVIQIQSRHVTPIVIASAIGAVKRLHEQGGLHPDRVLMLPLIPTPLAARERADQYARFVGELRRAPLSELEGIGMAQWIQLPSLVGL